MLLALLSVAAAQADDRLLYELVDEDGRTALSAQGQGVGPGPRNPADPAMLWRKRGARAVNLSSGQALEPAKRWRLVPAARDHLGKPRFEAFARGWMNARWQSIRRRTLSELTLPGTHDAGTYKMTRRRAPGGVTKTMQALDRLLGGRIALGWAQTQSADIAGQLAGGVRYFDIRPCAVGGTLYIHHGLLGPKLADVLDQYARFLSTARRELVLIKIAHITGFRDADHETLDGMLKKKLGPYLLRKGAGLASDADLLRTPLEQLTSGPARAILLMDRPGTRRHVFSTRLIRDSYANTTRYARMRADQLAKLRRHVPGTQLFVFSWTLTPDSRLVTRGALRGEARPRWDLRWLSRKANPHLLHTVERTLLGQQIPRPNVLYVDYFEEAHVLRAALKLNGIVPPR